MRARRIAGVLIAGVALVIVVVAAFSPYREHDDFPYRLIRQSVDVDASCATVFDYLGDSGNASDWSVFVDHITPLNADSVPDGARGSIRRSFRNADESGMRWDEYFMEVEAARRRRLRIYEVRGVALRSQTGLLTEQIYQPLAPDRCRLSFTLFFDGEPTMRDRAAMTLVGYRLSTIFASNIANVKRIVEARADDVAETGGAER